MLSSITACEPGQYKGKESTTIVYCTNGQPDACLPCQGETIKPNTGDSSSRPVDCSEENKVANAEHTACGKFTSLCYNTSMIVTWSLIIKSLLTITVKHGIRVSE